MTRHISIHAPREGSDPLRSRYVIPALNFYPRSPRGERPGSFCGRAITPHFYPRSPRGERLRVGDRGDLHFGISIHAPREGSDEANFQRFWPDEVISIHAPREGSDRRVLQSTGRNNISIHAPREGSDIPTQVGSNGCAIFLSTLPARGATRLCKTRLRATVSISIHAPREGSDPPAAYLGVAISISIHAPREGSDVMVDVLAARRMELFLSTLPARGATW